MLVYGDRARAEDPREVLARLEAGVQQIAALPPGLGRHAAIVSGLILCGQLAQGLSDAEFTVVGEERKSPVQALAMEATLGFAAMAAASWRSGFEAAGEPPSLEGLVAADLPATVTLKEPEGYAYYAVYPEAYIEAAKAARLRPHTLVVGLRSIGTSLAAAVAAALGAEAPVSVRPSGDPFARRLRLGPDLQRRIADAPALAVADEGPGLSGSSFGAVLALRPDAALFPSHGGAPGAAASHEASVRWASAARHPADFEAAILPRLAAWAEPLTGKALGPPDDLSGGAWREGRPLPAWPSAERRKYRLRTSSGAWLLKFAGLGEIGEAKLARAQLLYEAGFSHEPAGLAHGFLVERWTEGAKPAPRDRVVQRLGDYLALRQGLPAREDDGAHMAMLQHMARSNLDKAGIAPPPVLMDEWSLLQPRIRRVQVDGRLHAWEWITTPEGRILKTDALDHCCAHDLVGAQDIAWDVAGAEVEMGLTAEESTALQRRLGVDPQVLQAMRCAYAAFQVGWWTMAAQASQGGDQRLAQGQAKLYVRALGAQGTTSR